MGTFTLENGNLRLEFDRTNGALIGLRACAASGGWHILDRPQLGLSFRLLVPLSEEKCNNPVFGEKQPLSRLEIGHDNRSAVFYWDDVTSEFGGKLAIRLVLNVTLDDERTIFSCMPTTAS